MLGEPLERTNELIVPARYDLDNVEIDRLTRQLLHEREPGSEDKIVCYMLRGGEFQDSEYANIARTVECSVFDGKFGNDPREMEEGYGEYEDHSIFFLSVDTETGRPVGTLRVIENGPNGLKTLNDVPNWPDLQAEPVGADYTEQVYQHYNIEDPTTCWDVGTVAVLRQYEGSSPLLYRAMYVASQRAGVQHFFSIIDRQAFAQMRLFGIPFTLLHGTKEGVYMGSKLSKPLYGEASTFETAVRHKEAIMGDRLIGHEMAKKAFHLLGGRAADETDTPLQF